MSIYSVRLKSTATAVVVEADNYTSQGDYHFFKITENKQILVASFRYKDVIHITTAPPLLKVNK